MKLENFFVIAQNFQTARKLTETQQLALATPVLLQPNYFPSKPAIYWQGEITSRNVDEVWKSTSAELAKHSTRDHRCYVDVSGLQFIDTAGAGVMLRVKKSAKQQGVDLVFTGIRPDVRNVLELSKVDSFVVGGVA
jgi:anti-anti-sigma factor